MELQFRKLRANEIDVRIGSTKSDKGTTLLLYKDARCDMNILDETVGALGWKREHTRDNANCIVSIWDGDKSQWVSKEDTGTESNTEQEKGLASDSFKRACFNWGIGRELYTAGFTFIPISVMSKADIKYARFEVTKVDYDDYGNIKDLIIESDGRAIFNKNKRVKNDNQPKQEPEPKEEPKFITETQTKIILSVYKDENLEKLLKSKELKSLDKMLYTDATELVEKLKEIEKNKNHNT